MDDRYKFKNKICPICSKEVTQRYKLFRGEKVCADHKVKEILEYGGSH